MILNKGQIGCLTIIYCLLLSLVVYPQNENIKFSNIGVRNGMTANVINSLYRDSNGFIWIGTQRGLNRFDGYNVKIFDNISDSTNQNTNIITCISEDLDSNLWVGTSFGIRIKNKNSSEFKQVSLLNYNAFNCNDINYLTSLFRTKSGAMYIGTHEGFFVFKDGEYTHHLVDSSDFSVNDNYILSFEQDENKNVWIGTNTQNLFCFDAKNNIIGKYCLPSLYSGPYTSGLYNLFLDNDNNLWVGTQAGSFVFNTTEKEWDKDLNQLLLNKVGDKLISGIQADQDGNIWISTDGAGLYVINKDKKTCINISHQVFDSNSLSSNGVNSFLIDHEDIVWVGTYKQGLDYYNRNSKKFRLIQHQPQSKNSLSSNDINCIVEDSDNNLWIGTNGGGISILNRRNDQFKYIVSENKPNSISSNVVVSMFEDSSKDIWIGTYFGGLNKLNVATGEIKVFKHSNSDSTSISDDRIWCIAEDHENNLWIATMGGGVNLYNPKSGSFKRYMVDNSNIAGDYINHLFLDSKNRLWASTSNGLCLYNKKKDNFDVFINPEGDTGNNLFGILVSVYEDSRGWLWLSSNNGLIRFNYEEKTATIINRDNGLISNPVNRVLEDKQGNLWVSGSSGLTEIKFTNITDEGWGGGASFTHFDGTDGLQGNEFSETAALKTNNGELLFGGVNGLNIFNPEKIFINREIPNLVFTKFKIFNEIVEPNKIFNKRVILNKPINKTDEVVLKYSENFFSIEFAALTYFSLEKNKYRYRLVGFDENWFDTNGANNFATYTNLNNGNYIFQLIGANADGTWNNKGISIKIKVLPPVWKKWYAIIIYIIIISLALFTLRSMILFRERMNVRFAHERMEAKRVHELDLLKMKFFTNISHEFRTPLSLILSPVEKLLPKFKNSPDEKYLNHIYLNSKKLLNMINQLLDFRKMEISGLTYNPSHEDIIDFINDVVVSFNDLGENKNIGLLLVSDIARLNMLFDKDKLEKILFNLLSNAFKYTLTNGLVLVEVFVVNNPVPNDLGTKKQLLIKIKDNGIGIEKGKLGKIFARFYQADNLLQVAEKGTGIGLSLVHEYVAVLKGAIEVESAVGVGTCFNLSLPIEGEGEIMKMDKPHTIVLGNEFSRKRTMSSAIPEIITEELVKPVVLIVEDNDDLRAYLKENLSVRYAVLEAENGKQAWSILQKSMPDIVVSDIMMPEMDGLEFCKLAKNNSITCHIPFIFLTARNSEQHQLDGLGVGADDFIPKPFNLDILEIKIRNLIQLKLNIQKILNTKLEIEPKDISITSLDKKFMEKALDIIEKNISSSNFTVEEFSREIGISRMQLYKKLVSLTGKAPHEFMRIFRLKRAAQLLQKSQLTISEVAYQVGYNNPKIFSKHFKKEFNILPSKYVKQFK